MTANRTERPLENIVMLPLPAGMTRMETGQVQFGDDWPGIFLRGDNAIGIAIVLKGIADMLPNLDPVSAAQLRATALVLTACDRRQHNAIIQGSARSDDPAGMEG